MTLRRFSLIFSLLLGATACGSARGEDGAEADPPQKLIELFSWWTAPGEAEALQALVDTHKRVHPDARIFNAAAASGEKARERLSKRLAAAQPPDLYQQNAHDVRAFLEQHPDQLVPVEDLFDGLGLRAAVYPELISDLTLDGHIYSIPVNVHRENTLYYNQAIFAAHDLQPPRTFQQFLDTCATLKRNGVIPLATAHQGWILRIMFASIAMGQMGGEHYHRYFTKQVPPDDAAFRAAIDTFAEILAEYTNPDAGQAGFGWTNAAQAVHNGDAAMFLHGDWAKGYFVQLGWVPGEDFGSLGAPGAQDLFLYGLDVFALPKGAANDSGAREFLTTIVSKAGQLAFNRIKGSSPIRRDLSDADFDSVGRATIVDLEGASVRMRVRSQQAWDDAFADFATNRDKTALLQAFIDQPPGR